MVDPAGAFRRALQEPRCGRPGEPCAGRGTLGFVTPELGA